MNPELAEYLQEYLSAYLEQVPMSAYDQVQKAYRQGWEDALSVVDNTSELPKMVTGKDI